MKQQDLGLNLSTRRTRKMDLLELMNSVVPWSELVAQLTAVALPKATESPPFPHENMLRLHLLQQLFGLSDFAMEEALFETPLYRTFAGLEENARLPDRVSILRFRHLLEKQNLTKQFFETVNAMVKERGLMLHRMPTSDKGDIMSLRKIEWPIQPFISTKRKMNDMRQSRLYVLVIALWI